MSFGEHLDELRRRLILCLVGLAVSTAVCLYFARLVFSVVMRPAYLALRQHGQNPALQSLGPPDTILLYIKLSVLCGLIVCSPWLLWQVWQFVSSGLYAHERRYARLAILPSFGLFALGVAFMYLIVLPLMLNFFMSFNQSFPLPDWGMTAVERRIYGQPEATVEVDHANLPSAPVLNVDPPDPPPGSYWINQESNQLKFKGVDGALWIIALSRQSQQTAIINQYSVNDYASFVLRMSLAFGLAFQVPVVVLFLAISGIVAIEDMARMRRYVIFGFTIFSALLTPPDVISQVMLAVPMILLFETGLLAARIVGKRTAQDED